MIFQTVFVGVLLFSSVVTFKLELPKPHKNTYTCDYYNPASCKNKGDECSNIEHCHHEVRNHCYAIWKISETGEYIPQLKGCFTNNIECYDQFECVENRPPVRNILFCCCEGDMCNKNYTWNPPNNNQNATSTVEPPHNQPTELYITSLITIISLVGILTIIIVAGASISYFNKRNNDLPLASIELNEIVAAGKFGSVWRATHKSDIVAVKTYNPCGEKYWRKEKEFFNLSHISHNNILYFYGVSQREIEKEKEFWLVTAFHERGTLCDYLKVHVITWSELHKIAESIVRGLAFMHRQVKGARGDIVKPAVAHRNLKSKNILLKEDMSACIMDFGSSLVFHDAKAPLDTFTLVGSIHYMAPELLDGGIRFSMEGYLRIDMYACALILWELVRRCSDQVGTPACYKLPFEEEVGLDPTFKIMKKVVMKKNRRPHIRDTWRQHPGLAVVCDTIEESWDIDPEARVTAACIMERLSVFDGDTRYTWVR